MIRNNNCVCPLALGSRECLHNADLSYNASKWRNTTAFKIQLRCKSLSYYYFLQKTIQCSRSFHNVHIPKDTAKLQINAEKRRTYKWGHANAYAEHESEYFIYQCVPHDLHFWSI